MKDSLAYENLKESQYYLKKLHANNNEIHEILKFLPSVNQAQLSDLRRLTKIQAKLIEQSPRFSTLEQRLEIDKEKFNTLHLLQVCIKFLRDNDIKTRGA